MEVPVQTPADAPNRFRISDEVPVLVAGAGPVGLVTALQLARYGVKCMLLEKKLETTQWPKMDVTNARSMELIRRMGMHEDYQKIAVPGHHNFNVLFSTGLSEGGEVMGKWYLPSPDDWRREIAGKNDGTTPRDPYLRCSQILFEPFLKARCEADPLIEVHSGIAVAGVEEDAEGAITLVEDTVTGRVHKVRSKFVVAADGAGSRLRKSIGVTLTQGSSPISMHLIHFKSRDLSALHKQGSFWHLVLAQGAVVISQDESETWTLHVAIPSDKDVSKCDPVEEVAKAFGGFGKPYPIAIDEVLVQSVWKPTFAVADKYASKGGKVFLAGDSAHQNFPGGGFGMNTGLGDAYDIGWKLAAVINGWGGDQLLRSYEAERRFVGVRNVERSAYHLRNQSFVFFDPVNELGAEVLRSGHEKAMETRATIRQRVVENDTENKDHGIEMDYRFPHSPVVVEPTDVEHPWTPELYTPSTRSGCRAPHVWLKDGTTPIFDIYHTYYTLVDFSGEGAVSSSFLDVAQRLGIPLGRAHLPDEPHARSVWGRDQVLVRPDGYVSWRREEDTTLPLEEEQIEAILKISAGQRPAQQSKGGPISKLMQAVGYGDTSGWIAPSEAEKDLGPPASVLEMGV